jgi:hypothetical protein
MATNTLGPEGALAALEQVREWVHTDFGPPGPDHSGRLAQLDSALATARMAVEHLFDEDLRERDLHRRMTEAALSRHDPEMAKALERHGHQGAGWVG